MHVGSRDGSGCARGTVEQAFQGRVIGVDIHRGKPGIHADARAVQTVGVHIFNAAGAHGEDIVSAVLQKDLGKIAAGAQGRIEHRSCRFLTEHRKPPDVFGFIARPGSGPAASSCRSYHGCASPSISTAFLFVSHSPLSFPHGQGLLITENVLLTFRVFCIYFMYILHLGA